VRAVLDGGPGARAGLRTGDVLVASGERELRSIADLYAALAGAGTSRELALRVLRGTQEERIAVALDGAPPAGGTPASTARPGGEHHL